jgi:hypothetical protein
MEVIMKTDLYLMAFKVCQGYKLIYWNYWKKTQKTCGLHYTVWKSGRVWHYEKHSHGVSQSLAQTPKSFRKSFQIERCKHFDRMFGFGNHTVEQMCFWLPEHWLACACVPIYVGPYTYVICFVCVVICSCFSGWDHNQYDGGPLFDNSFPSSRCTSILTTIDFSFHLTWWNVSTNNYSHRYRLLLPQNRASESIRWWPNICKKCQERSKARRQFQQRQFHRIKQTTPNCLPVGGMTVTDYLEKRTHEFTCYRNQLLVPHELPLELMSLKNTFNGRAPPSLPQCRLHAPITRLCPKTPPEYPPHLPKYGDFSVWANVFPSYNTGKLLKQVVAGGFYNMWMANAFKRTGGQCF